MNYTILQNVFHHIRPILFWHYNAPINHKIIYDFKLCLVKEIKEEISEIEYKQVIVIIIRININNINMYKSVFYNNDF